MIEKTDGVIVETDSIKQKLRKQGIDIPIITIQTVRRLKIKKVKKTNEIIVLCVSRLSKEKNVGGLLKIMATIKSQKKFKLWVAGGGPEAARLRRLAKALKIEPIIRFLGKIDFGKINEIYSQADIFAYQSKSDTQAVVVSEAMAAGLPIVAYNLPGPKDLIVSGKEGWLAENDDDFRNYLLEAPFKSGRFFG